LLQQDMNQRASLASSVKQLCAVVGV